MLQLSGCVKERPWYFQPIIEFVIFNLPPSHINAHYLQPRVNTDGNKTTRKAFFPKLNDGRQSWWQQQSQFLSSLVNILGMASYHPDDVRARDGDNGAAQIFVQILQRQ